MNITSLKQVAGIYAAGMATAALVSLVGIPAVAGAVAEPAPVQATQQIEEDDPGWDCRTMGNRVCGVQYASTHYVVHYDRQGFVDMVATHEDGFTEELSKLNT